MIRHTIHKLWPRASVVLLLLWAPAALAGQPGAIVAQQPGFTLVPYGWVASLKGTIGVPGEDVDDGEGGLLERLDVTMDDDYDLVGFMFYGEWRSEGRWMAFIDSVWANFSRGAEVKISRLLPSSDIEATVDGNIVTGAVGFRAKDWENASLTVYGGARYYDLKLEVKARGGVLPSPITIPANDSWTDALLGARLSYGLGKRWQGLFQADYAFGDSDGTWDLSAILEYTFSWGAVRGGYRHMIADYTAPAYRLDVDLTGPLLGVAFTF
ncbi:MAG: hypothetical protein P8080_01805 [Gammaproteobacteria bacterium]